jgi:polyhydroxybutyrate depolymerase
MHRKGERTYLSVEASVQFWIDANGCTGNPVVSNSHNGAVQTHTWANCKDFSMTVLCKINDWGHRWPGPYFTDKLSEDDPLYNFNTAEMVWSFFKQFP